MHLVVQLRSVPHWFLHDLQKCLAQARLHLFLQQHEVVLHILCHALKVIILQVSTLFVPDADAGGSVELGSVPIVLELRAVAIYPT